MMTSYKRTALLTLMLLAAACAPKTYRLEADLVYPPPPERPRVRYVETFYGDVYFAGSWSDGIVSALVGDETQTLLFKPFGVVADDRGNVYISDGPGYVMVLDREKQAVRLIADSGQAKLLNAGGLAFHNGRRELYACDMARKAVMVIDPERNTLLRMYAGAFSKPVAVAVDEVNDRIAVADVKRHTVVIMNAKTGAVLTTVGSVGTEEGSLYFPIAVAFDGEGNLYVSDEMNFRVQKFDTDGAHVATYGSIGVGLGQFSRPKGIGIDSEGHLYVVDAAFGNVQIFDAESGNLLLFFGQNGMGPGEFSLPHGLFIDAEDRIYVVDQINRRVQVFQYLRHEEGVD